MPFTSAIVSPTGDGTQSTAAPLTATVNKVEQPITLSGVQLPHATAGGYVRAIMVNSSNFVVNLWVKNGSTDIMSINGIGPNAMTTMGAQLSAVEFFCKTAGKWEGLSF